MNGILAIALISVRNAIRSKIVMVLLAFLLITLIGLPLTLQGDGTLPGHVRVLIRYTLGLATLILSIATVWASCAAISTEIRDRQIQLVVSKPVRASQIWLGKWLGLMAINVLFLMLCFVSTYAALRGTTTPDRWSDTEIEQLHTEILVAQYKLAPQPRDVREEVQRQYRAARARGEWPEEIPTQEVLPRIERALRTQANSVPAGSSNRWVFNVPHPPPEDRPLILRYRFSLSVMDLDPVSGSWTIGSLQASHRQVETFEQPPRTWHSVAISPDRIEDDGTLTAEFANHADRTVTVIFQPDEGLHLMVYAGGFLMNYFRAGLLILFHLSFLAAVGVTAGAYFSIPVAAMTSFYALLLINAARFIGRIAEGTASGGHGHAHGPHGGWFQDAIHLTSHLVHRGLYAVIRPLESANPLDYLVVGEWIPWTEVGYMFGVKVVLYSGILMVLGAWHMARKEVALPS